MQAFTMLRELPLSRALRLMLGYSLACSVLTAHAADETLAVIAIKANAETAKTPVTGYVAKRTTAGTKTDTPLSEVPQSISVITKDQVRDQAAQSVAEAVRYSAGITAEPYGVDNRGDYYSLRGGSSGEVVLDGLRQPITGYWGSIKDEPYSYERIEVIRGPSAVTYGQNPPGGLVNLVTKKPQATAQREVTLQYGNFDFKQASFDFTGPVDNEGKLLYRVVGLKKDSGTQVDYADNQRDFLQAALTYLPIEGTSLTLYTQYQDDESGNTNAFLPWAGTIHPAPNGLPKISSKLFIGEPAWDSYGGTRKRVGYALEHQLNADWKIRHNLRVDDNEGHIKTIYAAWYSPSADYTAYQREWYNGLPTSKLTVGDLQLEGKLQTGDIQHTLLFGVDGSREHSTNPSGGKTVLDSNGNPAFFNVYHPVYGQMADPGYSDMNSDAGTIIRQIGISAQDQLKFADRYVAVLGLRHDSAKADNKNPNSTDIDDSAWSKRLGFVYLGDYGLSPYISYSESFQTQSGSGFGGVLFKPKRGKQYELGMKWLPDHLPVSVMTSIFNLTETNRLAPDPVNPQYSITRGKVSTKGFELEGKGKVQNTEFIASYTYTDAKDTSAGSPKGDQLETIPKQTAAVWVKQNLVQTGIDGLNAGIGVRYLGKNYGLDFNTNKQVVSVPGTTLVDALIGYDTQHWTLALNAKNLFDKDYVATCLGRGDCWFGNRRNVIGSVTYKW